ncbi:MAG: hypothetical protein QXR45_09675 [Candidatus Bathyarchaeia archaeon]
MRGLLGDKMLEDVFSVLEKITRCTTEYYWTSKRTNMLESDSLD